MSTVINIRGTGGSGKSTLVRRIMDLYGERSYINAEGRKQPLAILCTRAPNGRPLYVPGHYNTACGGCDTIKTVDEVYRLVNDAVDRGVDVLYEGIMVMDEKQQINILRLHERLANLNAIHGFSGPRHALHVIGLATPIEACLAGINERRARAAEAKGKEYTPVDPKNTVSRARTCERNLSKLEAAGVAVERLDREAAYHRVCDLLGLPA